MGIKGLTKYIRSVEVELEMEKIPSGAILVIDGNGWLFHLLKSIPNLEYGGSYDQLYQSILTEMFYFQSILELRVVVFFDGENTKLKGDTRAQRRIEIEERWLKLYHYCSKKTEKSLSYFEIPKPIFSTQLLITTLKTLNIEIITTEFEADQDIARFCFDWSQQGIPCFCYGDDSDFIAMSGIAAIRFSDLTAERYVELQKVENSDESHSFVRVFRRNRTSQMFGLSESQFVEWCILSGNDFTARFELADFDGLKSEIKNNSEKIESRYKERCGDAKRIIKAMPEDFRLSSSNPELQMAIEYSRDFYELRDLSNYPIDPPDDDVQLISLSTDDRAAITTWIESHQDVLVSRNIAEIGWSIIRDLFHSSQKKHSVASNLVENITPTRLNALERMVHEIQSSEYLQVEYKLKHPQWQNIMFTHNYQLVCKFLLKYMESKQLDFDEILPFFIFNENLFYLLLEEESIRSAVENLSISKNMPPSSSPSEHDAELAPQKSPSQKGRASERGRGRGRGRGDAPALSTEKTQKETLPIDAYQDEILYRIRRDRVTIIQGETGCGKSSRIPVMLFEDAQRRGVKCRMMVSQPRRIAASSLMKRVRAALGMKVGLRMGHGIKDESDETNIFFVTTGYLVRLLAFQPDLFHNHTHIIVDEVHERSIDGDVLCFLVKQLLESHPTIHVVLMSATIHTDLYGSYFSSSPDYYGDMKPLSVGLRRFPIDIRYIEDLGFMKQGKPEVGILMRRISETCDRLRRNGDPGVQFPKDQYAMVQSIIESQANLGTGVLVFVAGMSDITDLQEKFMGFPQYDIYAIHSDIPFEEQESAFDPTPPDKIKIVIATNAAESSITLPDVDIVICLGLHKHTMYDPITHRSLLQKTFISKASATQRAGRTGRVRPGCVFRIYTKRLFESFSDFDTSEVLRTPLQETILSIRIMLETSPSFEGVIPVLQQLIEPPDTRNVENSFQYLFDNGLITSNDDEGFLTPTGKLVGALPVGITLGRLIAYGIQLGVAEDAAKLAIALTLPKSPFRIASPVVHTNPNDYNDIVKTIFHTTHQYDKGQYSEPLMLLNLLNKWRDIQSYPQKENWAYRHGVVSSRMKHFDSASSHLWSKIQQCVDQDDNQTILSEKQKLNFLRLILAWTSEENILRMKPHRLNHSELSTLTITNELLTLEEVDILFPSQDCLWKCHFLNQVTYTLPLKSDHFINLGENFAINTLSNLVSVNSPSTITWVRLNTARSKVDYVAIAGSDNSSLEFLSENLSIIPATEVDVSQFEKFIIFAIQIGANKKRTKQLNSLRELFSSFVYMILQTNHDVQIHVNNCSLELSEIRKAFMNGSEEPIQQKEIEKPKQLLTFDYTEMQQNFSNPLFPVVEDIPYGMKLYHAYLSGYNKVKSFRIKRSSNVESVTPVVGSAEWAAARGNETREMDDNVLNISASAHSASWKIFSCGSFVSTIMPRFSVPGASLYAGGKTLFGTAHNCLALGAGGQLVRCEGVTLFPPGCAWLTLALACVEIDSYKFMINRSFPSDEYIESNEIDLVDEISNMLKDSRDGWVVYNPTLVSLLLDLFSRWTDNEER